MFETSEADGSRLPLERASAGAGAARTAPVELWVAAGLALATGAFYASTLQRYSYGDGRLMVRMATSGSWTHNKLLYRPIYELVHGILSATGQPSVHAALVAVSVACSALAVGVIHLTLREVGCGRFVALATSLLVAFSPTVWFFGTCIEVHPPQLAAAALVLFGLSRTLRTGRGGGGLLVLSLYLCSLVGTHPTGLFWAPALLGVGFLLPGEGSRLRGLVPALALLVLFTLAYRYWVPPGATLDIYRTHLAGLARRSPWRASLLWRDFGVGAGALLVLGLPGLVLAVRRGFPGWPANTTRRLLVLGILLVAPFLVFLPAFQVYEHGAYYISLFPLLALCVALLPRSLPRAGTVLLLLALPVQLALAHRELARNDERFPDAPWIEALRAETGGEAAVLVDREADAGALLRHSSVLVVRMDEYLRLVPPERLVAWVRAHGLRLVLMRSVVEHPRTPLLGDYVQRVLALSGRPVPGRSDAYWIVPSGDERASPESRAGPRK